ncbi:MAG: hypothetical protein ACTSRU_17545 [Candidatus Hodarchaeales archaeon]
MSHAEMDIFWSATDDKCCEKLGGGDFTISIVANRNKKMLGRLDIYKPFPVTISGIDIKIEDEIVFDIPQDIQDEVDEKVSRRVTYYNRGGYYGGLYRTEKKANCGAEFLDRDGLKKRYNSDKYAFEAYDEEKKEWVLERDFYNSVEVQDGKKQNAIFVDGMVYMEDGRTFNPAKDNRIFGDVPPPEMLDVCEGEHIKLCKDCAYRVECLAYFTKVGV